MSELKSRADGCTNMVQLEALFLSVTAGISYVPAAVRRLYAENVARLGGEHQDTGEVMEDMEW